MEEGEEKENCSQVFLRLCGNFSRLKTKGYLILASSSKGSLPRVPVCSERIEDLFLKTLSFSFSVSFLYLSNLSLCQIPVSYSNEAAVPVR